MASERLVLDIGANSGKPGRLNTLLVALVMLIGCFLATITVYAAGITGAALFIAPLVALPATYFIVTKPKFGILFIFIFVWFIMFIVSTGLINFPIGTFVDLTELLLIIGLLIQLKRNRNWEIFNNPISYVVIAWILYNVFQIANPSAESRMAWLYTIRSVAGVMLLFFVFVYNIDSIKFIRIIIRIWLCMAVLSALYGLKQEFWGFSDHEYAALTADPLTSSLLFIDGHWRKFSTFSDPVAFSYNMVACTLLCCALITGTRVLKTKLIYAGIAVLCFWSMIYSGTRGAFVLVPGAFVLWTLLNLTKQIFFTAVIGAFFFLIFISYPATNPNIVRFQSSFRPGNDASYNVRKANQLRIKPYILSHPLGGGLGATGVWGVRFAPYSFLASFPPDSGYVRVAVELGWVGLLLFCTFMFVALWSGIRNYYRIKDPELKAICLAMLLIIFALNLGNFPQEALVQFPSSVYFYLYLALLVVLQRLDNLKHQQQVS